MSEWRIIFLEKNRVAMCVGMANFNHDVTPCYSGLNGFLKHTSKCVRSERKAGNNRGYFFLFFFITYSQPGPSFINLFVQYSQSDLRPLRPLCGEALGVRDSNPGRADLVTGTLTTRPPHLT